MATKKNIQKNDRKESGAGLAAGIESENKTQGKTIIVRNPDVIAGGAKLSEVGKIIYAERLAVYWSRIAEEEVTTLVTNMEFIAFGTQQACKRLAPVYEKSETPIHTRVEYNEERQCWAFRLTPHFYETATES